jgi:hypothetical protein
MCGDLGSATAVSLNPSSGPIIDRSLTVDCSSLDDPLFSCCRPARGRPPSRNLRLLRPQIGRQLVEWLRPESGVVCSWSDAVSGLLQSGDDMGARAVGSPRACSLIAFAMIHSTVPPRRGAASPIIGGIRPPKSGSHPTPRWSKRDSNPWSPPLLFMVGRADREDLIKQFSSAAGRRYGRCPARKDPCCRGRNPRAVDAAGRARRRGTAAPAARS